MNIDSGIATYSVKDLSADVLEWKLTEICLQEFLF